MIEHSEQLAAMHAQLAAMRTERDLLRVTCQQLEHNAAQQKTELEQLVVAMEREIEIVRQDTFAHQLDEMQVRLARVEGERENAVQELMSQTSAANQQLESMHRELGQRAVECKWARGETEKERSGKEHAIRQLDGSTRMVETLREQLAEAAVALARYEEQRKMRLLTGQGGQAQVNDVYIGACTCMRCMCVFVCVCVCVCVCVHICIYTCICICNVHT